MNSLLLILVSASLSVLGAAAEKSIPAEWQRQIDKYDAFYSENDDGAMNSEGYPTIYTPLMGNGYFSHSKGVRSDSYFIAGVYNNETTSPSIRARIPATFAVQISNSKTTGTLLDMRNGTFFRRGDIDGAPQSWYELRWYAHMERRNIYVMELQVFGHEEVNLKLVNNAGSPTDAFNFEQKTTASHLYQCGNTTIPETPDIPTTRVCMVNTRIPQTLKVSRQQLGKTMTFITAVRTSLDSDHPEADVQRDMTAAEQTQRPHDELTSEVTTQSPLLKEHIHSWSKLWLSGIEIQGNRADAAMAVNASLYAIYSSTRDDWPYGLAPGGLTNYYSGHSFWDTETWMYPAMLLLRPTTAKSLIDYRFNRLDGAYKKAKTYNPPYAGAMFPWESAFTGVETCPLFADTGLREQHISADISLAVWQYWSMTKDKTWLQTIGYPILKGVADFYVSRVNQETLADGTLVSHIMDVIPPDEYVSHGNDSAYTNYGAAMALRFAVNAAAVVGETVPTDYTTVADSLVILYNETLNIHPEYREYPGDTIKQADVVLLHYPWEMEMSASTQQSDLEYYAERSDNNGPAMTWGMHAIGFKDLAMMDQAASFFNRSFQDNTHLPFHVWTETPSGNAGNFITGAGGFLQTLVQGYAGLRVNVDQLKLQYPACPVGATGLNIRGLSYLGNTMTLSLACNSDTAAKCPSQAHSLSIAVTGASASAQPLNFVTYNPTSGAVERTDKLVAGKTTSVPVTCYSEGALPQMAFVAQA